MQARALFLNKKGQYKEWDTPSELVCRTPASVLLALLSSDALFSKEAACPAVSCPAEGTKGGLRLTACKEPSLGNDHVSECESGPPPS